MGINLSKKNCLLILFNMKGCLIMMMFLLHAFIYGFILGVVLDLFVKPHIKNPKNFKHISTASNILLVLYLLF